MDMDLLNFLSMDMGGYGFYKPHPCQFLSGSHVKSERREASAVSCRWKSVTEEGLGYG